MFVRSIKKFTTTQKVSKITYTYTQNFRIGRNYSTNSFFFFSNIKLKIKMKNKLFKAKIMKNIYKLIEK